MAGKMDDPSAGEHCSILLTDLPQEWFQLEDSCKRDAMGPTGNVTKISFWDESRRSAVVHMSKMPGTVPTIKYPTATVAPIIVNDKASISLTVTDSQDCQLLESIVKNLNMKMNRQSQQMNSYMYIISGSLDMIVDFRRMLEENIMMSRVPTSVAPADSANTAATGSSDGPDIEQVQDRFHCEALVMMKSMDETPGVQYNLNDGLVFIDRSIRKSKETFYNLYDKVSRLKLKGETIHIPEHVSISVLKSELESLKKKYDKCGFVIMEDSQQIKLVSNSTRQFDSILTYLKDILFYSNDLSYVMPDGRVLRLLKKDIVKENVDIIVNAANGRLDHAGGVAAAINKASNGEVQQFSKQYMKKRNFRSIPVGEVAVTDAGRHLKCRKVIHAVGPESSHFDCQGALNKLVRAILNEGEKLGLRSIALPAISTGIFGVSKDLVAMCFFTSISNHRFYKPIPVLEDIRIVIIDQPTFGCFHQHFSKILLSKNDSMPVRRSNSTPSDHDHDMRNVNPTSYARVASEDPHDKRGNKGHDGNSRPRRDGNQGKNRRDNKSVSPGGSDKKKTNHKEQHGNNVGNENKCDFGSSGNDLETVNKDKNGSGDEGGSSPSRKDLSVGRGGGTSDGKHDSACRGGTEHDDNTDNPVPKDNSDFKPHGKGGGESNETFYDASDKEEKNRIPEGTSIDKVNVGVNTSTSSNEKSSTSPVIDDKPDVSPDEVEYPKMDHLVHIEGSDNNGKSSSEAGRSTSESSLPQHLVIASSNTASHPPGFPSSNTGHHVSSSSELNPNAVPYFHPSATSQDRGSCCTCAKVVALVDARKCGHLQCRECKMVKYPACPICYPFMENVRFWNIPATTMDFTFSVSGTSLSGYSPHHTIAITYKFPSVIDGHGICSGQEIFSILLPNTTEGNEVFLLYRQAFDKRLTFTLAEGHDAINYVVFAHSIFKIKPEGGGMWGYPDPDYLARAKSFLESLIFQGTGTVI